jgi:predicted PP-loop superfamily ATPase
MKICSQCILPETFPGVSFNAEGLCSQCQQFVKKKDRLADSKREYEQKFLDLMSQVASRPDSKAGGSAGHRAYDVLMAYSGGKDSTYTMSLLRNKYKLRILAMSLDNGFVSPAAMTNIKNVTDSLGVDHVFFKPRWDLLKKVFSAAADREMYSKKTLERASTICTSCIGLVKSMCLKMAVEQDIPMIGFGWSPGQAPVESSIMRNNPSLVRMAQQAILGPLREVAGEEMAAYFLEERHYADPGRFPYNVHPMAWEFYNEEMIIHEIRQFGWTAPTDTDSNSSNCLLNAYANDVHVKRYHFHPYVWEIANMVREGVMTREEGYQKIYEKQDDKLVCAALERLAP